MPQAEVIFPTRETLPVYAGSNAVIRGPVSKRHPSPIDVFTVEDSRFFDFCMSVFTILRRSTTSSVLQHVVH